MKSLKEAREIACLSQKEVVDKAGISITTYSRIENGKQTPRPATRRTIAKILKMKPQDIQW
jgi:transcriptional regulator with XRE-family HTH domain